MKTGLILLLCIPFLSLGQLNIFSVNELDSLQYKEKRPVVFFINTDWCLICLGMENKVLKNEEVAKVLNENYYLVILNAERKDDVVFKGKRYKYIPSGINEGKHQLAMLLAKQEGKVSFPSIVILYGNNVLYKNNSYMNKIELLEVLSGCQ